MHIVFFSESRTGSAEVCVGDLRDEGVLLED